ncbi:MAG: DUF835 domain-containing protein [Methanobacteriota archaeon]|nr:MAG: DUF835 domain-containing protein [Euryarchaeota archaeon]
MVAALWIASLCAGSVCLGAGLLALMSNPKSIASMLFSLAMCGTFIALITGSMYPLIESDQAEIGEAVGKVFVYSMLLSETFLWQLTMVFPLERKVTFRRPNAYGLLMIAGVAIAILLSYFGEVDFVDGFALTAFGVDLMGLYPAAMIVIAMGFIVASRRSSGVVQRRSGFVYLTGLWIYAFSMIPALFLTNGFGRSGSGDLSIASHWLVAGVAVSGLVFAVSIARGLIVLREPKMETSISSTKASYELLHRRIYLIEEEKSNLAFEMFVDILRGRCFDCENDESFPCESLDCDSCGLPCPCKRCMKYSSRAQGIVITRRYPNEIREDHYLQTTPIIWLSTVAGEDHLDPAKLSLLTDMLVNYMERSHNGVILVDGVEYLVSSNGFPKVLRAIDKWTEIAMTSSTKLIISIDPRAFDERELAMMEKNKEVITPDGILELKKSSR